MLNLLKFKDKAEYADGRASELSGAEAYGIYAQEVVGHLAKVGGAPMFSAQVERLMLGEVEELWDTTAIAMYPSRKAMLEMISSPDYQASAVHREAGLAGRSISSWCHLPENGSHSSSHSGHRPLLSVKAYWGEMYEMGH